jgi:hypothetical protein
MIGSRLTTARLTQLAQQLPSRYTTVLPHLARTRVLTGAQLDRLLATAQETTQSTARVRRRIMHRLRDCGLVATLERRIGGVRAGSAGHIYTLTTAGHRFIEIKNTQSILPRRRHAQAPGKLFIAHTIAISEIYVRLVEESRTHNFRIATFATEPCCWWPQGNGNYLRPDAYTVLRASTHSDCWWLEIDNNTESLPRIRQKCSTYLEFFHLGGVGPHNAPPRVLFTAPDQQRTAAITDTISTVSAPTTEMITVTTHKEAAEYLITELEKT